MNDIKDAILEAFETSLKAQLRAIRNLRNKGKGTSEAPQKKRLSHVDMAYAVLSSADSPLHVSELLARIRTTFGVSVDRESIVSSLAKKVNRGDRFVRTDKNTFGLTKAR